MPCEQRCGRIANPPVPLSRVDGGVALQRFDRRGSFGSGDERQRADGSAARSEAR
ncbi:MAG: hypothetical protein QMD46_02955 [Methanomicrobiales archaeon]|nr:hypothetical protein [Methanomicrobiales archaeon]